MGSRGRKSGAKKTPTRNKAYKEALSSITKKIKKLKKERGFFVDMDTGEILKTIQGGYDEIVIPNDVVREMARYIYDYNKNIAFIHNHPTGSTLSGADALTLARRNHMAEVAVTNGKTYTLRPKKTAVSMRLGTEAEAQETKLTMEAWEKSGSVVKDMKFNSYKEKRAYQDKWEEEYIFTGMDRWYRRNAKKYGAIYTVTNN